MEMTWHRPKPHMMAQTTDTDNQRVSEDTNNGPGMNLSEGLNAAPWTSITHS